MDSIKKIGIFCKQKPEISREVLKNLTQWLREKNYCPLMGQETAEIIGETSPVQKEEIPSQADLIIVLGGDGTLLSVARLIHPFEVPILAVNLGSLGFLTEVSLPELYDTLAQVLKGEPNIERRMLLKALLKRKGQNIREDFALNDVVINKSAARIVNLEVHVNHQYMTSYRADGLIISTPTGSTAYSLSAGGPIIHPSINALVLSPICPFALTNRPIVIPSQSTLQVKLITEEEVQVTLDGQTGYTMYREDVLEIKQGPTPVCLIQAPGKNYYQILRRKLHWGRPAEDRKQG
ncbi:MAG: NAD(+) kinase [Nitrospinaceae bacterium]|nr:NAD(+) kinase [Nitrospinaceae bacterium]NIR53452.1 NAD(+) kinase [Nitrospinaceae bacterium]NIS83855.1 NAD(+) kinase [Nitrospinaceae bacterium]NIT80646.1 NAD(+) kinase [Nitrospinaceae bacterium]NIU42974.1 NAD(+) kinase [Nitrospinaceae bacterium]